MKDATEKRSSKLIVPVDPEFHERIRRYARANNRSMAKLIRHVLLQYMRQNPILADDDLPVTEK